MIQYPKLCKTHTNATIYKYTRPEYHPDPEKLEYHQCQQNLQAPKKTPSGTLLLPEIRPPVLILVCTSPISSLEIRVQSP